jgi:hypothetical protein
MQAFCLPWAAGYKFGIRRSGRCAAIKQLFKPRAMASNAAQYPHGLTSLTPGMYVLRGKESETKRAAHAAAPRARVLCTQKQPHGKKRKFAFACAAKRRYIIGPLLLIGTLAVPEALPEARIPAAASTNNTNPFKTKPDTSMAKTLTRLGSLREVALPDGKSPYVQPAAIMYELDGAFFAELKTAAWWPGGGLVWAGAGILNRGERLCVCRPRPARPNNKNSDQKQHQKQAPSAAGTL